MNSLTVIGLPQRRTRVLAVARVPPSLTGFALGLRLGRLQPRSKMGWSM